MWKVVVVVCVAVATAHAKPLALEAHDVGGVTISTPKGWTFAGDATKGMAIAQQDPKRKDAAQLLVIVSANAGTATEDQILDQISTQAMAGLKVVKRGAGPGGAGKLLIADGAVDGIAARLGAIALAANGGMVVGVLIAKQTDFAALGGTDLVVSVLGSLRAPAAAPAPATDQVMEPQYDSYGVQLFPLPTRKMTIADLVGTWEANDGSSKTYVNSSSGTYAGHSSVSTRETWKIDAKGNVTSAYTGVTTGIGGGIAHDENRTGKITIDDRNVVFINWKGLQRHSYILRGWFVGKDVIIMNLIGPFYDNDPITNEQAANPNFAGNLRNLFAKKR